MQAVIAKKLKKLNDLENDVDDALFNLINRRMKISQLSKELLEKELNAHYNALIAIKETDDSDTINTDYLELAKGLAQEKKEKLSMLKTLKASNEETQSRIEYLKSDLEERMNKIKDIMNINDDN